jgi:RNA polymerase sigma factor (TIGR02999 family)
LDKAVTGLLQAWRAGDQSALDQLLPLIYDELHRLADRQLRIERPGHTFRPTDLVSEAYLRLTAGAPPDVANRAHFFAIAARSMRQILISHARRRFAAKRGSNATRVDLDDNLIAVDRGDDLLALDEGLTALSAFDERKARAVELHYFGGLTQEEIAAVFDVHVNTVARDLRLAAAWLHNHLRQRE